MCDVCREIIKKLVHKGLVSMGNVIMCHDELVKEAEAGVTIPAGSLITDVFDKLSARLKAGNLDSFEDANVKVDILPITDEQDMELRSGFKTPQQLKDEILDRKKMN